jgi:serine/threonine protein phosphatase PrpC
MFRVEAGAATHAGKVRRQNEDSYLVATRCGVWAVADGMGGHQAGDVASRLVVEELNAIDVPATGGTDVDLQKPNRARQPSTPGALP